MSDNDRPAEERSKGMGTRSPNHPSFGLATAIQKAVAIYNAEHTAEVPAEVAVKHMGFTSSSGPAVRALAAMKTYGLMTEHGGNYRLTQDGLSVVMHAEDEAEVIARMAGKPLVFQQVANKYPDKLPTEPTLKAYLVKDLHFQPPAADTVIAAIRETHELVKQHRRSYNGAMNNAQQTTQSSPTAPNSHTAGSGSAGQQVHVWSLGKGVSAELRIAGVPSAAQFALLKKYVELAELAQKTDGEKVE